jgi:hypothetical protein
MAPSKITTTKTPQKARGRYKIAATIAIEDRISQRVQLGTKRPSGKKTTRATVGDVRNKG